MRIAIGQYLESGQALSNSGETITLEDPAGGLIQALTYSQDWYRETDGDGFSLAVVDPALDASDPANWRSSALVGGSPGEVDPTPAVGDLNGDGVTDRADAAVLLRHLGRAGNSHRARGDIDGDRATTLADLALLQSNLGSTIIPSAPAASVAALDSSHPRSVLARDVGLAELADSTHDTNRPGRARSTRAPRIPGFRDAPRSDVPSLAPHASVPSAHRTLLAARRLDRAVRSVARVLQQQ
jgi:hypothetical protein